MRGPRRPRWSASVRNCRPWPAPKWLGGFPPATSGSATSSSSDGRRSLRPQFPLLSDAFHRTLRGPHHPPPRGTDRRGAPFAQGRGPPGGSDRDRGRRARGPVAVRRRADHVRGREPDRACARREARPSRRDRDRPVRGDRLLRRAGGEGRWGRTRAGRGAEPTLGPLPRGERARQRGGGSGERTARRQPGGLAPQRLGRPRLPRVSPLGRAVGRTGGPAPPAGGRLAARPCGRRRPRCVRGGRAGSDEGSRAGRWEARRARGGARGETVRARADPRRGRRAGSPGLGN